MLLHTILYLKCALDLTSSKLFTQTDLSWAKAQMEIDPIINQPLLDAIPSNVNNGEAEKVMQQQEPESTAGRKNSRSSNNQEYDFAKIDQWIHESEEKERKRKANRFLGKRV